MKMSKSNFLIRQSLLHRPCRRHIAGSSSSRTSTSPQRQNLVAPVFMPMATAKSFSEIPGPMALPMLRHSAHILPRIGSFHHAVGIGALESLRDKYGDLVRLSKSTRSRPLLYVFDPEIMREVYESRSTEPPRFDHSPLCQHRKNVGSNCPIHSDDTKAIWTGIRMILQEGALLKNYEAAFDDIASDVTRRLGELRQGPSLNVELETEIYRWAIETIGMLIFGIRLGCLDGSAHAPNPENKNPEISPREGDCSLYSKSHEELTAAERLVKCSRDITRGNFLTRTENTLKTDSSTFNNALKTFDRHFSLTEHFLLKALYELNSGELKPEQVLLDKLRPLERRILPVAADVLLAGVDPLAHTALSMFYQLSLHAAQQQRAHDEVVWVEASKEAGASTPDLSYVAACAREAMRLHPVTGGVVRRSKESLIVAGYEIPEGVDIVLAHSVSSKAEQQWGRARAFVPERWCGARWQPLRARRAHALASRPFGTACPAARAARASLAALAARLLEKYRLEWHGPLPNTIMDDLNKIQPPYYFVLQNAA